MKNIICKILKRIKHYDFLFTIITSLLTLVISVIAIYKSDISSKENNVQLGKISALIDTQILITNRQSEISKNTLRDQLLTGIPRMQIKEFTISDTENLVMGKYNPHLCVKYYNSGLRPAEIIYSRISILYESDSITAQIGNIPPQSCVCGIKGNFQTNFLPAILLKKDDPFYIAVDIKYKDNYTGLELYDIAYLSYHKKGEKHGFSYCTKEEVQYIYTIINKNISRNNIKLNEQQEYIKLKSECPVFDFL